MNLINLYCNNNKRRLNFLKFYIASIKHTIEDDNIQILLEQLQTL